MKILHILDHSLPLHSGYTFRSHNIFKAQKKMGVEPVVLTSPKHEENLKGIQSPDDEVIEGILYYRTGRPGLRSIPGLKEIKLIKKLGERMLHVCKIERPDLIHVHSPVLNIIPAIRVAGKLGLPVIYEIRAFWEDAAVDHGTYGEKSWKYRLIKTLETNGCKKADHVITICDGLKNDLLKRGVPSRKTSVVSNGINPLDFRSVCPDSEFIEMWNLKEKRIIGFIGSFYRYEGLDFLIDVFSRIAKKHQDIMLLLVGGGEVEVELRKQIDELGISDRVIMPGRVSHEKVPEIYALTDILVYPRYSMRLTELVTPLKPLEAMAMGRVVVASDVGGHRELIRHGITGLLFSAGVAGALHDRLLGLLSDNDMVQTLQANAVKWVRENRTWEKTTFLHRELYWRVKKMKDRTVSKGCMGNG